MAIVICPECGKKDVSDSAKTCPNCGYDIKSYCDKIRTKQEQQIILDSISLPEKPIKKKPSFFQWLFILSWALLILPISIFSVIKTIFIDKETIPLSFAVEIVLYCLVFLGLSIFTYYCIVISDYKKKMKEYNDAMRNPEQYKTIQMTKLYAQYKTQSQMIQAANNNQLFCPKCGSTNIQIVQSRLDPQLRSYVSKYDRICVNCKHMF
ncbi:MAG: zinc ribbon domain-containing protein [Lachnospiraceae bacterium]|nr:zinc ribbon domain-containing protein [Lachnospiraceae bacterium]